MTVKIEHLIVLRELRKSDIEKFEFIAETPARGLAYYSNDLDVAAIDYGNYIRVYYNREVKTGKTASSFSESIINGENP